MIDVVKATLELLKQDGAITALVGSRVYGGRLPEGSPLPAIVVTIVGGEAEVYTPIILPTGQLDCWSKVSGEEARRVYRAVHDALHGRDNVQLSEAFLASALEETQGQDLVDPETGWFRNLSFFRLTFRKEG